MADISSTVTKRLIGLARSRRALDAFSSLTQLSQSPAVGGRIGVLSLWGIGDAVLSMPLLRGLKQVWPGCSVEVIGKPFLAELFAGELTVDKVHFLKAPWTSYHKKYMISDPAWRDFLRQLFVLRKIEFDWLVSLRLDPRDNLLMRTMRARARFGLAGSGGRYWLTTQWHLPAESFHQIYRGEVAALACERLTGLMPSAEPHFDGNPIDAAAAERCVRAAGWKQPPLLVISFGAGRRIRSWDPEKITAVLERVKRQIGFIVSIDDGSDICNEIKIPAGLPWIRWRSDLKEIKGLLSVADVVFCADSGIMHMAAAVGCSTVSVFGPTSLSIFKPRGSRHRTAAIEPMPCRPCYDVCIYRSPRCLDQLGASQVADALLDALTTAARIKARGTAFPDDASQ